MKLLHDVKSNVNSEFKMKDLGGASKILGMNITRKYLNTY